MLHLDDEATTFEPAPLGARQRLIPSATFVSKRAHLALGSGAQPAITEEEAEALVIAESPSEIVESFDPNTAEWLAIARAVESSSGWVVSSEPPSPAPSAWGAWTEGLSEWSTSSESVAARESWALPCAASAWSAASDSSPRTGRRRDRLSILALAVLGLLLLGGAALPPDRIVNETPTLEVRAAIDRVLPSVYLSSFEAAPPIPEVDAAPVIVKKAPAKSHSTRRGPRAGGTITVDASSALGGLRPRRAW